MKKLIVTQSEVLRILGISIGTLEQWIEKDGFPKSLKVCNSYGSYKYGSYYGKKRYSIKSIKKWIKKRQNKLYKA